MEWVESIRRSIDEMEAHLMEIHSIEAIANGVHMSPFYLQKGFKVLTGYTMVEYMRNRRLYLAALDVITDKEKVIDLADRYGYDTPESFTKAFVRFHGCSPTQLKQETSKIKVFLPLKVAIRIQGGYDMDYVIEKMDGFKVIGYERVFDMETSYKEIPKFWDTLFQQKIMPVFSKEKPETQEEKVICDACIGEFGVCVDLGKEGKFRYLIAGTYKGGDVPEEMTVFEFPEMTWAKFACKGPMPGALQAVNTKIYQEWLPGNPEYDIAMGANIEWYSEKGSPTDADYESAVWIPVKKKNKKIEN